MMTPKSLFQCYCCARLLWMKWPETVDKPQFGMADFQWTDCPISLDNMTVFASGIHEGAQRIRILMDIDADRSYNFIGFHEVISFACGKARLFGLDHGIAESTTLQIRGHFILFIKSVSTLLHFYCFCCTVPSFWKQTVHQEKQNQNSVKS